jgi:hypothetical protein
MVATHYNPIQLSNTVDDLPTERRAVDQITVYHHIIGLDLLESSQNGLQRRQFP